MPKITIPEWVGNTPEQMEEYTLTMWFRSSAEQDIDLTRDEFISLKAHLAVVRGHGLVHSEISEPKPQSEVVSATAHKLTPEALEALGEFDRNLLDSAFTAMEEWHGCTTPAEEFVRGVLLGYGNPSYTPDDAECDLKTFRENFKDAIRDASKMAQLYPELVTQAEGAA